MAKQIIILDISENQGGISNIRCVFWFSVSSAFPNSGFVSAYPGITGADQTALNNGTVIEEIHQFQFPNTSIVNTWSTVEAVLLAFYNARKSYRAGTTVALPDPGAKYQIYNDSSTGWSA